MDFSPHTPEDEQLMLDAIGASSVQELFEPVPEEVRLDRDLDVPDALSEPELMRTMERLASTSAAGGLPCFAGGGAYDHHVPAVVRALASRAEFATSYTPYQAELSQGVLQALFEFQSLVCEIYGMEVANASLYDGANALVEAVTLAVRQTKRRRVVIGGTVHPHYREVLETYTRGLDLAIAVAPPAHDGTVDWEATGMDGAAAVVGASPNVFGRLEDIAGLCDRAHLNDAVAVAVSDPTAMGILEAPGRQGADVAVGEGQALGNALYYGGPYVGLFATKAHLVRQMPGRISGETLDVDGRRSYVLTLQGREQHIRRARATSNVCTNQTLMAIAAAIHLAWLGPAGLRTLGTTCVRRTAYAARRLAEVPGCSIRFEGPHFKEIVLATPVDGRDLARRLARKGFIAGPGLGDWFPELARCLLVAVTERRSRDEIDAFAEAVDKELAET
ncbi:MAG: aminomethyl-transferring glycine dehydrogenase subunit GcvPA [Actinobacteria bacterium]|nr:aminomethyl-transferring glycine dehydrogenase subunit GcvPA [Actinomycetota bacterium]